MQNLKLQWESPVYDPSNRPDHTPTQTSVARYTTALAKGGTLGTYLQHQTEKQGETG